MMELHETPASVLVGRIARRELSPVELVEHFLERVACIDPVVRSFVTLDHDDVRRQAKEAERLVSSGQPLGRLHGLPVSVKDLILTRGIRTTRGSRMFADDVPSLDAPVVERLRKAGAILFGKTNTSEFGWKGATSNLIFPETRNPWNVAYSPGGSSGGAAAGVACGLVPVAIGTDGGGSIRIPAALTGVLGFKPSVGRWPVFPASGVGPLSHIGPIVRFAGDAALLDDVLAGFDARDCYSVLSDYTSSTHVPPSRLTIGWSSDLGFMPVEPDVARLAEASLRKLEALGHRVVEIDPKLGDPTDTVGVYFAAGAAAAVSGRPDWKHQSDPGLVELVERHERLSAVDYARAQLTRARFTENVAAIFDEVDLIATPTVPVAGFECGLDGPWLIAGATVDHIRWLGLTSIFNLCGNPAVSLPIGLSSIGLPVGLQIVGPRNRDRFLLQVCEGIEQLLGSGRFWPPAARTSESWKVTTALWLSGA